MRENLLTYISELLTADLPFLLLRKKGGTSVDVLHQNSRKLHKTVPDKMTCGVFSKFQKSENQIFIWGEMIKKFTWDHAVTSSSTSAVEIHNEGQMHHEKLVDNAVKSIKNTELKKVVLSKKQTLKRTNPDLDILKNLLDMYPNANCYFFYHPVVGKWMGATPETLLSYKNNKLQTMSLAGTQPAQNTSEITWGNKEKEEQKLVTDFIVRALESSAVKEIKVGEVETASAGNLLHLKTEITAITHFENLQKCISELHPTPAVCGLPRKQALEYILTHENYDRSFYTGYLGWNDPVNETADYYVNLRCMELFDDHINVYAGGGITSLSDPHAEFQEVQNKLMTMATVLV
ncbi:isochorismate synthase [Nonlabens antarcticus]|uniref:isochorismate synthase n=1 Tax=Nonlabens antarcticus TaxID=392714 RepID=UPI001891B7A3|nr:isochorismate synthase [Nonlabens antarcticus]